MYAKATKALGTCDRCGFTYKLSELKCEVQDEVLNGLRVCRECFDPDHPQYRIGQLNITDPQSLYDPRVDTGKKNSTNYFGFNPVNSTGIVLTGHIGKVTITTN